MRTARAYMICIVIALLSVILIVPSSAQESIKCGTNWQGFGVSLSIVSGSEKERAAGMVRPSLQTSIISPSGHFRIHFDTAGTHTPALLDQNNTRIPGTTQAYIDSIALAFDLSWEVLVNGLGYDPPPPDAEGGDDRYDIYVVNLSPGLFGETQFESTPFQSQPNARYLTWILIDNDYSTQRTGGLPGAYVTAAHEFFHAIQVGSYGFWDASQAYWYEISSTWVEEEVFPGIDDFLYEVDRFMTSFRTTSFSEYSSVFPGYERVLFAHYLSERYGKNSVRRVWELMRERRVIPSLELFFEERGTSLEVAYSGFSLWNFFTADRADPARSYARGASFPRMVPLVMSSLIGEEMTLSYGFSPLSQGLFGMRFNSDTIFVMLTNTDVDGLQGSGFIGPAPAVVLSRGGQNRPSQRLGIGLTGGLSVENSLVWDIEYFTSQTGDVIARTDPEVFPNPWDLSGPHDLIIPTSGNPGTVVQVYLISADFRSTSLGSHVISFEKGSSAVRLPVSEVRNNIGSGSYVIIVQDAEDEQLSKVVIVK